MSDASDTGRKGTFQTARVTCERIGIAREACIPWPRYLRLAGASWRGAFLAQPRSVLPQWSHSGAAVVCASNRLRSTGPVIPRQRQLAGFGAEVPPGPSSSCRAFSSYPAASLSRASRSCRRLSDRATVRHSAARARKRLASTCRGSSGYRMAVSAQRSGVPWPRTVEAARDLPVRKIHVLRVGEPEMPVWRVLEGWPRRP
jgi:hypothetical protein